MLYGRNYVYPRNKPEMMASLTIVILAIGFSHFVFCQENAGTSLAPSLEDCYNTTRYVTRDYRLPATINVLVEIIRQIEDGNTNQDARVLSYEILHRFRQDGIRKSSKTLDPGQGIPYSPKGMEASLHNVLLKDLIPGNAVNFNNKSLTKLESCSLHYMISSSVETQLRGDESTVCNKIAHYTYRIQKREVETFDADPAGRSSCPLESGVIYTKWGAVKAGLVLAGIASGFNNNPIRTDNGSIDSIYASTIAGQLSEVTLNQVTSNKVVGNKGGWNSTVAPKYYYLSESTRDKLYLTDAEIRGGLDGLYLGLNIDSWKSKSNNIKISQILDLYYSRGVFNESSRACNRKTLVDSLVTEEKLEEQTASFNFMLDRVSVYSYTPNRTSFPAMAKNAVSSLRNYLKSDLQDLECSAENDVIERVSTEVLIFIDISWDYEIIQPFISYVLENIDVNKYESSYTIFDAANCDVIVNKTRSILDFYDKFNLTEQQKYPTGFDFTKVIQKAENLFKNKLNNETDLVTAQSMIVLMLPHGTPTVSQSDYVRSKRDAFQTVLPDLRIVVAGPGTRTSYESLVSSTNDILTLQDSKEDSQLKEAGNSVIDRFRKLPRSIVNPKCGSNFASDNSASFEITQYVEPSGVNYHRISPNYFYEGQTLKIRGQSFGSLTVCTSRKDANPRENATGIECKTISSDEISIDISNYCSDDVLSQCSPIYISVQGKASNVRCTEAACRFPDNIKYTIALENVHCSSSGEKLLNSVLLICVLFAIMRF